MKKYTIHYIEDYELMTWNCRAYDRSHAEEKFFDMLIQCGGSEGIELLKITVRK